MRNSQRLAPILRGDVSGVEPAKARDQRSRDRGDRRPFAQIARLLSSAEEAHYAQTKRYRSEEHTSELQSRLHIVCRLLLEKKKLSRKTSFRSSRRRTRVPRLNTRRWSNPPHCDTRRSGCYSSTASCRSSI